MDSFKTPIKLGAHLSVSGGYEKAILKAKEIGANCLQIFSGSPRVWARPNLSKEDIEIFVAQKQNYNIDPIYFHAPYLINLAGFSRTRELSKKTLIWELNLAPQLDILGSVVHLGSFKDPAQNIKTLTETIKEILQETPSRSLFIIENSGTRKIGKDLEEIAMIIEKVKSPRLRVCLDTCHLFSVGYDIRDPVNFESLLQKIDALFGIELIELWHLNDSKDPLGSLRDRHENIGAGSMGLEPFSFLLNHHSTRHLPFIIETPGFKKQGPDKENLDILKSLLR